VTDAPIGLPSLPPRVARRLATGLVAYGVAGLALAAPVDRVLLVSIGRLGSLAARASGEPSRVAEALAGTVTVLHAASATAAGFDKTIDSSAGALTTAATDLRGVVPRLRELEQQAGGISIPGAQPLPPTASPFGQIAGHLEELDGRLGAVASGLVANRATLATNATSLADLATKVSTVRDELAGGGIQATITDAWLILLAAFGLLVVGAVVPAGGALAAGLWLRRLLGQGSSVISPVRKS